MEDVYRETFKSPFLKKTEEEAQKVLESIRESHPKESGWVEDDAYIERVGVLWRAVRVHHHEAL